MLLLEVSLLVLSMTLKGDVEILAGVLDTGTLKFKARREVFVLLGTPLTAMSVTFRAIGAGFRGTSKQLLMPTTK